MVRQRSATPLSPVQIWVAPPKKTVSLLGCRFSFLWSATRFELRSARLRRSRIQFTYPARRSTSLLVRRRARVSSPMANTWVQRIKTSTPQKGVLFFVLEVPPDLNCALHAYGVAESGSHTPLGDRQACLSGVERGYLRALHEYLGGKIRFRIFIQADEGSLVCNQRACPLDVIATKSRMAPRASVYKFVGLITYIPLG